MSARTTVTVAASELRDAFDFASFDGGFEHRAWICLDTGRIFWRSDYTGMQDEDFPEDFEESNRYLAVPNQRDLDLGHRLALAFVAEDLPDDLDTVAGFFRRRGAYARFKDLLAARGRLERWYEFENQATEAALRAWCAENGIEIGPKAKES